MENIQTSNMFESVLKIKDYLNDESLSREISFIAVIKQSDVYLNNSGNKYMSLVLADSSARIDSKKWTYVPEDSENLKKGNVCRFYGVLTLYKNSYQFKVNRYELLPEGSYDSSEFNVGARKSSKVLEEEISSLIDKVSSSNIKKLLNFLIFDEYKEKYFSYPAASSVHHGYRSGLAFHSLNVTLDALKLVQNYSEFPINTDLVIAGGLLHDIGKTVELSGVNDTVYTKAGKLLGHIALGYGIVLQASSKLSIPFEEIQSVLHIILSHHGSLEFGSPVVPLCIEAFLVSKADDMDSKLEQLYEPLKATEVGELTERLPFMDKLSFFNNGKSDK